MSSKQVEMRIAGLYQERDAGLYEDARDGIMDDTQVMPTNDEIGSMQQIAAYRSAETRRRLFKLVDERPNNASIVTV